MHRNRRTGLARGMRIASLGLWLGLDALTGCAGESTASDGVDAAMVAPRASRDGSTATDARTATDGSIDARAAFADAVGDGDHGLVCPAPPTCTDAPDERLPLHLSASEFGADARFIAASLGVVLGVRGPAGFEETFAVPMGASIPDTIPLPASPLGSTVRRRRVASSYDGDVVLECSDAECAVFTRSPGAGFELSTILSLAELGEEQLEGAAAATSSDCAPRYDFCVFGSGLHCWVEGMRVTEIPPRAGQRIRDVATQYGCAPVLVAGDSGLLLKRELTGWQPIETGTQAAFDAVSIRDDRYTAAARTGEIVDGNPFGFIVCNVGAAAPVELMREADLYNCRLAGAFAVDTEAQQRGLDTHIEGMTHDGRLVRTSTGARGECRSPETWNCGPPHPGAIDYALHHCGASANPVIVTPDAIYRTDDCFTVP